MINLEWYNIVAILVGIVSLIFIIRGLSNKESLLSALISVILIPMTLVFYAIWGGIFWW